MEGGRRWICGGGLGGVRWGGEGGIGRGTGIFAFDPLVGGMSLRAEGVGSPLWGTRCGN